MVSHWSHSDPEQVINLINLSTPEIAHKHIVQVFKCWRGFTWVMILILKAIEQFMKWVLWWTLLKHFKPHGNRNWIFLTESLLKLQSIPSWPCPFVERIPFWWKSWYLPFFLFSFIWLCTRRATLNDGLMILVFAKVSIP